LCDGKISEQDFEAITAKIKQFQSAISQITANMNPLCCHEQMIFQCEIKHWAYELKMLFYLTSLSVSLSSQKL